MQSLGSLALSSLTTLRVGGIARNVILVDSVAELASVLAEHSDVSSPVCILGGGSNVLFSDQGWDGIVLLPKILGRTYHQNSDGTIHATFGAGEQWDDVVCDTVRQGLWGLENLSGIPGTVGATPVQNVGAYGVEVSDRIVSVLVYDRNDKKIRQLLPRDCYFGYRDSVFKRKEGSSCVIVSVTYRLSRNPCPILTYRDVAERFLHHHPDEPKEVRDAVLSIRANKFPDWTKVGTAGSFFQNPIITKAHALRLAHQWPDLPQYVLQDGCVKVSLAWILDHVCALKGVRHGAVGLFERQPLVLVTYDGATAHDVHTFASYVSARVKEETDIDIVQEVTNFFY